MAAAKSSRLGRGPTCTKQPSLRSRVIKSHKSLMACPAKSTLQIRRRRSTSSQKCVISMTKSCFLWLAAGPAVTKVRLHASNSFWVLASNSSLTTNRAAVVAEAMAVERYTTGLEPMRL